MTAAIMTKQSVQAHLTTAPGEPSVIRGILALPVELEGSLEGPTADVPVEMFLVVTPRLVIGNE